MSEYQYYEFVALDRPLAASQLAQLREISSRAQVTPTRFVNTYNFGDFRGDARALMERCFDAHLYLANWGTRALMLRLPRALLDPTEAAAYGAGEAAVIWATEGHVLVALTSQREDGDWESDGDGLLPLILPVRAELAAGDLRALYLGWLLGAQAEELEDDALEPPVPPNLATLTEAQKSLAAFLRLDEDLIAAAATASPQAPPPGEGADQRLAGWIAALPPGEKDALLLRAVAGDGAHLGAELLQRFRRACRTPPAAGAGQRRMVAELLRAAADRQAARQRLEAERQTEEADRRERAAAAARESRLQALAARQEEAWPEVDAHMASKRPAEYDEAVRLLQDLQLLSARGQRLDEFARRVAQLRQTHAQKVSLLRRLERAGL